MFPLPPAGYPQGSMYPLLPGHLGPQHPNEQPPEVWTCIQRKTSESKTYLSLRKLIGAVDIATFHGWTSSLIQFHFYILVSLYCAISLSFWVSLWRLWKASE